MNERTITPLNDGDNPPEFPSQPYGPDGMPCNDAWNGMLLRDFFASQMAPVFALEFAKGTGWLRAAQEGKLQTMTAEAAYMVADAMLRARKGNES